MTTDITTGDTIIDLVRHGAVDGEAALYGRFDIALSPVGWRQLEQALAAITAADTSIDAIISSPLQRCQAFAAHWAQQQGMALDIVPALREYDFGDWDGIPFTTLFGPPEDNPDGWSELEAFAQFPAGNPPPGGERIEQVYERVVQGWQQITEQHGGQHVVVMCHGAVIRLILGYLLPVDWRDGNWYSSLAIHYGSRTRIRLSPHLDVAPVVECIGWLPAGSEPC
ncbi:histidine phosphatase family protein [Oceanobacter sp. 3_MG-2023]|uniref:histidine phosphatase family protein n=1 Tax=Oceanobacter sp. 3_MG-2023 TaxID=3062622 RepID=UPI002734C213|nr:histidine phosphatase family protein [Oceanobacter sp. 3_MG-2023]MDP2504420.1 histidine phosphatase family protein [Oceanobacter sp. 3_MG-2023]